MAEFLGSQIVEQGQQWAWDQQTGDTLIRAWRGSQQWATAYHNSLKGAAGVLRTRLSQEGEGPVYIVTAEYGQIQQQAETDGTIPYFWELAGNMIDRSVFDHPFFKSAETIPSPNPEGYTMTFSQVNDVKQSISDNLTGTALSQKYIGWTTTQQQLWTEIVSGRENYQVSSYVLRINRTHSSLYANTISTANVGKLYTYAQIQSEASSIASPISVSINSNVPSSGAWLKQAPILTELSNRKLQMTQEWWWSDNWSTFLYDAAT